MKKCSIRGLTLASALVGLLVSGSATAQFANYTNLVSPETPARVSVPVTPAPAPAASPLGSPVAPPPEALGNTPAGVSNSAAATPVSVTGYVPDDKYKLRAGDRVAFQIVEDREPTPKSIVIADSGELDVPYIGRVMVSEKTCKEASAEIKALLEKEYYHRATVIVSLDAANKLLGRVYVWGQVRTQGPIEMSVNENMTASKALLRAGGFADFANKKKVKLVRTNTDGSKENRELNMVQILEDGRTELDVQLQPDDFIIVPSRLINF